MMDEKININKADVEELAQLTGIGPTLGAKIVEYRTTVHPFEEVIELTAVPGISERMVRQFEDRVTVGTGVVEEAWTPVSIDSDTIESGDEVMETAVAAEPEPELVESVGFREPTAEPESEAENETENETPTDTVAGHTVIVEPESELIEEAEPLIPPVENIIEEHPMQNDGPSPINGSVNEPIDAISQRRGCIFILIGALTGAILGAVLTLALLSALNNGSLQFARADRQLQTQLEAAESEVNNLLSTVEAVQNDVGSVSTQANDVANDQATLSTALDETEASLGSVESDLDSVQAEVNSLEDTAVELEERLDLVADSAETFDAFLDGMRALLGELPGGTPTETPTPTVTVTAPRPTRTPFAVDTVTPRPTRTPRPTSTPITLPTTTPEQQP